MNIDSERKLHDVSHGVSLIDLAIEYLKVKGLVYEGRLAAERAIA
jgi:hypothetical protein